MKILRFMMMQIFLLVSFLMIGCGDNSPYRAFYGRWESHQELESYGRTIVQTFIYELRSDGTGKLISFADDDYRETPFIWKPNPEEPGTIIATGITDITDMNAATADTFRLFRLVDGNRLLEVRYQTAEERGRYGLRTGVYHRVK